MKIVDFQNQTTLPLEPEKLEEIAQTLTQQPIECFIVSTQRISQLNATHRGKDAVTDVLSFPMTHPFSLEEASSLQLPLGSIFICDTKAIEMADRLNHTPQEEVTLLFIHGLLHLLGYDHEVDQGQMRQEEARLIEAFNLPNSLIVRTQEKGI
jgi:probable rRNA maturation factor